jgi:hypothetical protein
MKYTKQLVSGRDIDLTQHNLGVIKQLRVDDFMGELDVIDFIKPFYLERLWKVNGLLEEGTSFTFYIAFSLQQQQGELLDELIHYLTMLYKTEKVTLEAFHNNELKVIVRDDNGKMIAVIDDSNFDVLCETIMIISNYPEPVKKEEEKIEGDEETLKLFEKYQKEYDEKHKSNKTIEFEEIVREVIHTRKGTYEDVKNLTVWQLNDTYMTYVYMENERFEKSLVASGCYKVDKNNPIKRWQDQTKLSRN